MKKKVLLSVLLLASCLSLGSCRIVGIKGDTGPTGPSGAQGEKGKDGVSIQNIEKTSTSGSVDTYTITYSDGSTSTFKVTNGVDGNQGIQGEKGEDGRTPTITISEDGY